MWTKTSSFVWNRVSHRLAEASRESLCNQTLKLFFRLRNTDRSAQCVLHESHSAVRPSLPASSATWLDASLYPVSNVEAVRRPKREEEGEKKVRFAATTAVALQSWSHLRVAARWWGLIRSALRMSHSGSQQHTFSWESFFQRWDQRQRNLTQKATNPQRKPLLFLFVWKSASKSG